MNYIYNLQTPNIFSNVKIMTSLITKINKLNLEHKKTFHQNKWKINIYIQTKRTKNGKHSLKIIPEKSTQWCIQAHHSQLAQSKWGRNTNLTNSKRKELQRKKTWITILKTQITMQEDLSNNVKGHEYII